MYNLLQPKERLFFRTPVTIKNCNDEDMHIKISSKYMFFL